MYSKVKSSTLRGLEAVEVTVESDVAFGLPALNIVGLPDTAIRESRERVRTAIANSGFSFPDKRVTVNLSPANVRKVGTHFDLPIAVCILESSAKSAGGARGWAFLGELALDGGLNPVRGILPMLTGLRDCGVKSVVIPVKNAPEASVVNGIDIYLASELRSVIAFVRGGEKLKKSVFDPGNAAPAGGGPDFADVAGQESAKRALQTAAAGMHNVLMIGSPGSGKTMLARRLPSIMPDMTYEERLEVTKIHSIYGSLPAGQALAVGGARRGPDHTASPTALIGGGNVIKAGEATLAHLGILFLDELPEFSRAAIESLRKPMEDEQCSVSRVSEKLIFPSKFLAVGAMNPCPCGFYGDNRNECSCAPGDIARYRSKLSGPFLDRIDMLINVQVPGLDEVRGGCSSLSSAELKKGIQRACSMQKERFRGENINYNSQMRAEHIKKYCRLNGEAEKLLEGAYHRLRLSIRSYDRILRVSRTLADLEGSDHIQIQHVAEAVSYKCEKDIFR